jgi:REP element-mobilizing transposase RayT
MKFDPQKHHRRSIRLPDYDYSQPGAYFITMVTYQREPLFGEIVNGEMRLSAMGQIAEEHWRAIPEHFPQVELGAFVVMPNHVHGIIILHDGRGTVLVPKGNGENRISEEVSLSQGEISTQGEMNLAQGEMTSVQGEASTQGEMASLQGETTSLQGEASRTGEMTSPLRKPTLGQIVAYYKYQSTKAMNALANTGTITKFWQRNYYEHIIRNDAEHNRINLYIESNVANWAMDDENPLKPA